MLPDAPRESDTTRDGFLSYAAEWHALVIGLSAGLVAGWSGRTDLAIAVIAAALGGSAVEAGKRRLAGEGVIRDVSAEPWYAAGGVIVGFLVGWAYTHIS